MKIFITGGTSGIGLALAEMYLNEGHHVGICGRNLDKVPSKLRNIHRYLKCYQVDVTDREGLHDAVCEFAKGHLDLMVANAGISGRKKSPLVDFAHARKIISTNVNGVLNAFEVAQKLMIPQKKGHLAAISSIAGMAGLPRSGAYCASKAAVIKLCESMCIDLAPLGIHISVILPGFVKTPLTRTNNYPMPWIMTSKKAAKKIKSALASKKKIIIFPWQMKIIMCCMEIMPRRLYRFLARFNVFKDD